MEPKNLVTEQTPDELWDTLVTKAESPETGKRIIARSVQEIREAAQHALEAGADWWQFHEHSDST